MAVESPADRAVFTNPSDFGEAVLWRVGNGIPVVIVALVQAGTQVIDTQDGPGVLGNEASLVIAEELLPLNAGRGDRAQFRGVDHRIKSMEPDGTGMIIVRLEEIVL